MIAFVLLFFVLGVGLNFAANISKGTGRRKFQLNNTPSSMSRRSRRERKKAYEEKTLQEKQLDFKRHLRTYLAMSAFFFVLNMVTAPGAWWFYWPILGWGIGVVLQGMSLYGPPTRP